MLGPRNGPREVLETSPLNEYLTGVLQPADTITPEITPEPAPEPEALEEIPGIPETGEEDTDDLEIPPPVFSPALDPKNRPASMGLSFCIRVSPDAADPHLEICVTWARYTLDPGTGKWQRHPKYLTDVLLIGDSHVLFFPKDNQEISLHVRFNPARNDNINDNIFRVLIQLVNRVTPLDRDRVRAEECIFQPQIRVRCSEGITLLEVSHRSPSGDSGMMDQEEEELDFLYRTRPVRARGHLCSATWREIDPEIWTAEADCPPFRWVDGQILPEEIRQRFLAPDVRTEYLPVVPVQAPEVDLEEWEGQAPELDAGCLSETWDPTRLREALGPLVTAYRNWISTLEARMSTLPGTDRQIAGRLLDRCRRVLQRMQDGLELLCRDEDVRLAFSFANRAMWLQARWAGRSLRWRPFQMGFILMALESVVNPGSPDRTTCDLLWVPTGTGKTEAYLALAAMTMAWRRRRALRRNEGDGNRTGFGVAVLSRYTLRLLTIQQFRRALGMVTACEILRVHGLKSGDPVGWRPPDCPDQSDFLWGSVRFSAGLWVGGNLTPNRLDDIWVKTASGGKCPIHGALSILKGQSGDGEPAQVLFCPVCGAILAIPPGDGLPPGSHTLHLVIQTPSVDLHAVLTGHPPAPSAGFRIARWTVRSLPGGGHQILTLQVEVTGGSLEAKALDEWWRGGPGTVVTLACFRPSRPGYFPVQRRQLHGSATEPYRDFDFEIWCPSPDCETGHHLWCEGVPLDDWPVHSAGMKGVGGAVSSIPHPDHSKRSLTLPDGLVFRRVHEAWRAGPDTTPGSRSLACRVPIPAVTVDEQIYRHCPSMVVATADKFARLPFEPRAAALFGRVRHYHPWHGYLFDPVELEECDVPQKELTRSIAPPDPPDLILQDELHLLEGPLGSLAGIYETAVDHLCHTGTHPVKYVASTATIREARTQIQALFARTVQVFPPPGLDAEDRFFIRSGKAGNPWNDQLPGQLYVGLCTPGRGPLTPVYRVWACLLQEVHERAGDPDLDFFHTLVGYFNAVRELAAARALYRHDIRERIQRLAKGSGRSPRDLPEDREDRVIELSSWSTRSTSLPAILRQLATSHPGAPDAVFATAMFGTGVDIGRLSLMVVHGQPKTVASYIQATGRVGRVRGGLVVTFLRASRPRDLSHYEFFCGFHRNLHRFVEPVTVMPFAPGVLDLACGPVMVGILRNRRDGSWHRDDAARAIVDKRPDCEFLPELMEQRARAQPPLRRPHADEVKQHACSELDRWQQMARQLTDLRWVEYAIERPPQSPVVLGDPAHAAARLPVVFENTPQSLREVEETISIQM